MQVHLYADDCQIYISFQPEATKQIEQKIQACLSDIKDWMDKSFLKLNPNKTNLIILNSKRKPYDTIPININFNNCYVPSIETVVSLGVSISQNLELNKFISKKVQICSFHLRNLFHIKNSLPVDVRIVLVTNLILSTLDYCNSLLAGATGKDLKPLQRIMNRAIRFIFNLRRRDHITEYAYKAHFLPVSFRIRFKICLLAYKIINGMSPGYLSDGLEMFQPTTKVNLRVGHGRDNFMFKYPPTKSPHNSLYSKLITNWNILPYQLRTTDNLKLFKIRLKTHLFRIAYPHLTTRQDSF